MNKNKHGRIGTRRNRPAGKTRASDHYTHVSTIEEEIAKRPVAHRDIREAFSEHTIGTFRNPRRARPERKGWMERIAARVEEARALAKKRNDERAGIVLATPGVDLSGMTVAQLKALCDDRGIDYKSKDTKATLLGYLA